MVKLEIGQKVMVLEHGKTREGTVAKVGRVWCSIEVEPYGFPHRFRMDDQSTGSGYTQHPHFYTMEQWAEREAETQARTYLDEQGISLDYGSPWVGKRVQLAAILKAAGVS